MCYLSKRLTNLQTNLQVLLFPKHAFVNNVDAQQTMHMCRKRHWKHTKAICTWLSIASKHIQDIETVNL